MKISKFLRLLLFYPVLCGPTFGQASYTGRAFDSGPWIRAGSSCGPQNGYACFVSDSNLHNFSIPGPNWGPNTCNWTSMATLSTCGNLTGANTTQTPADFGNAMIRCTDMNTIRMDGTGGGSSAGNPALIWTTFDSPAVNAWNSTDTGLLLKVTGGTLYVMQFNPATLTCTMTNPVISFPASTYNGAIWAHTSNNTIYALAGTVLSTNTVNLSAGSISGSTLYDFNNSQCLTNSVNGYAAGSFPQNGWTSVMSASFDDSTFAMGFSAGTSQGSGVYAAVWTAGQSGCDVYNTSTGVVTHNGTLVGTVSDAPWGGANGGKFDRYTLHEVFTAPNNQWVPITTSPNLMSYGTYNDGCYFWQKGTTNVQRCGIGAPNWKANTAYVDGNRVNPTANNAGDYLYQIVGAANAGTSGGTAPTWGQTPGQTTTDGTITWLNVGLGTGYQFNCDGHELNLWNGSATGKSVTYHSYANPIVPLTQLTSLNNAADQHFGNTNANSTDSAWAFAMSADVGTTTNLLAGPLPSPLYNEGYFLAPAYKADGTANCTYNATTCPNGVGAVRRAFHNYNSGWHQTFDVQNGMCVVSPSGNFAVCSTDGMGQFGSTSGANSCNVGGPDWGSSDSTDFSVGSNLFPNPTKGGNSGDYIYQVQSCSGACSTGTSKPSFPQTSGATVVDGTITWVNTGLLQNCRADDVIVKLTR